MMLLVLIVAALMGWLVHKARKQREAVAAVKEFGGWVHYDYEFVNGKLTPGRQPWAPIWLRRLVGDEYFQNIAEVSLVYDAATGRRFDKKNVRPADQVLASLAGQSGLKTLLLMETQATDRGLKQLRSIAGLEALYLWDATRVTDAGIAHLTALRRLKVLHISNSRMTDAGLAHLKGLGTLEVLSLQGNHFSDAGLAHVAGLTHLKTLCVGLGDCRITDAGLVHLRGLAGLQLLDLQHSRVTDEGLMQLKGLPKLTELWLGEQNDSNPPERIERLKAAMPGLKTIR
jgi:hypothetical protein